MAEKTFKPSRPASSASARTISGYSEAMKALSHSLQKSAPQNLSRILLPLLLLAYALFQSKDLWFAWNHSPFDALGWIAFLLWIAPLFFANIPALHHPNIAAAGIILLLAGQLGELNALKYAGLATLLSSLQSWPRARWLWLAASISWMPVFGYFLSQIVAQGINLARVLLAAAALFIFIFQNRANFRGGSAG